MILGLTQLDAVRGASEACDQAVLPIQRGSKRSEQAEKCAKCVSPRFVMYILVYNRLVLD
ncbi:MAG: hypothetical protein G01um101448_372 [Parcubacteria group bacterium Gr01-1014_48]|nr:MAG: hypothetical protein G01um101448_372 [Parcubacteria group bacterium Gr01-1014_48]